MRQATWRLVVITWLGVLLVVVGGAVGTSLWLLVGLLPRQAIWVYSLERPALASSLLESRIPVWPGDLQAMAVAQTAVGEVLVVKPRLLAQGRLAGQLRAADWQVERLGWLLRARQGENQSLPGFTEALGLVVRKSFGERLPLNPAVWAQGEFGRAVGSWQGGRLRIAGVFGSQPLDRRLWSSPGQADGSSDSWLVVPDRLLAVLPPAFILELNRYLAGELGFTRTTPDFLASGMGQQFFSGRVGQEAFVGQRGAITEFRERVASWLKAEDSRRHPRRRWFRLPDGSGGYELVPGAERSVLASSLDTNGCQEPLIDTPRLWVCGDEGAAVAAPSRAAAYAALDRVGVAGYQFHLGRSLVEQLPLADLAAVSLVGDNDYAVIDVFFTSVQRRRP